jgi:cbb3-type cytochrome oxidase maturation protein
LYYPKTAGKPVGFRRERLLNNEGDASVEASELVEGEAMEVLMILIPLSVALVALVGGVFWWSVHNGQFDDLEGPAHRILADDDAGAPSSDTNRAP